jgi:hypothetical protein
MEKTYTGNNGGNPQEGSLTMAISPDERAILFDDVMDYLAENQDVFCDGGEECIYRDGYHVDLICTFCTRSKKIDIMQIVKNIRGKRNERS